MEINTDRSRSPGIELYIYIEEGTREKRSNTPKHANYLPLGKIKKGIVSYAEIELDFYDPSQNQ